MAEAYAAELADFPIERLSLGFERIRRSWDRPNQMPLPAHIIRAMTETDERAAADQAWLTFKRIFDKHWHPDIGFYGNPPALNAAGEYAVRMIGGYRRFAVSELAHEGFIRKEFMDAYEHYRKRDQLQLTTDEAKAFLDDLSERRLGPAE